MTRYDYIFIAEIISSLPNLCGLRNKVARHFAEKLKIRNQRFKRDIFIEACNISIEDDEE